METQVTEKSDISDISDENLDQIIRSHVYSAMGVSLIPIPIVDFMALTGVQLNMVRKIAIKYKIPFSKYRVKNTIISMIGGTMPSAIGSPMASLVKAIPIIGQAVGVITMPIIAGASTYAIGKVFVLHFDSGGTLLSLNPETVKAYYNEMFDEGKSVATEIKKKMSFNSQKIM